MTSEDSGQAKRDTRQRLLCPCELAIEGQPGEPARLYALHECSYHPAVKPPSEDNYLRGLTMLVVVVLLLGWIVFRVT